MKKKLVSTIGIIYVVLLGVLSYIIMSIFFWNTQFDVKHYLNIVVYAEIFGLIVILPSILFEFRQDFLRSFFFGIAGATIVLIYLYYTFIVASDGWTYTTAELKPLLNDFKLLYLFPSTGIIISIYVLNAFSLISRSRISESESDNVKRYILDLIPHSNKIEIKEISEKTKIDRGTVSKIVEIMIEARDIKAEYFRSTNSILFRHEKELSPS